MVEQFADLRAAGGTDETLAAPAAGGANDPARRSSAQAGAELSRGALVGRYVVMSKLGAGGMGVVYAAFDPDLDRKVALKLLRPETGLPADLWAA